MSYKDLDRPRKSIYIYFLIIAASCIVAWFFHKYVGAFSFYTILCFLFFLCSMLSLVFFTDLHSERIYKERNEKMRLFSDKSMNDGNL